VSRLDEATEEAGGIHDQGFVRPRVLVLCPFRASARAVVETALELLGPATTVSASYQKFQEEFGNNFEADEKPGRPKPPDHRLLFHDNVDDDFKMGIQVNPGQGRGSGPDKGAYVRLYTDFYQSDLILASPLGLKLITEGDRDFLTSLELVVLLQADVLAMQNWEHVHAVLALCNLLPARDHACDFSRVRPYFLEGQSRGRRQLVVTTLYSFPLLQASVRQFAGGMMGQVRYRRQWGQGVIARARRGVRQVFLRVPATSADSQEEERFGTFVSDVLEPLLRRGQTRTLLFAPSYLQFVRIRNELLRREVRLLCSSV
jgi:U3 small nucleolar RNA-associated protein 25